MYTFDYLDIRPLHKDDINVAFDLEIEGIVSFFCNYNSCIFNWLLKRFESKLPMFKYIEKKDILKKIRNDLIQRGGKNCWNKAEKAALS